MVASRETDSANPVAAGSKVKVIDVPSSVLARLEPAERERVVSMCGEVFTVYDVDEWGGAWVAKWWHESGDQSTSHSLGLQPQEMEVSESAV